MMKKIVAWKNRITGDQGHGSPIDEELADSCVEYGNKGYPDIIHQAIDVDISKWTSP